MPPHLPGDVPDIACIGETMAVLTPGTGERLAEAGLLTLSSGGAESNVARHLASAGFDVAWLSRVGADPLGDRILSDLADSGVNTRWVERDPTRPTAVYFKDPRADRTDVYYYRRESAASAMSRRALTSWPLCGVRWVHLSGITCALSQSADDLIEGVLNAKSELGFTVSFDINYRPALWTPERAGQRLRALARKADVVLVGLDEAHTLWDTSEAEQVRELLPEPDSLVVKDGGNEAVEFDSDGDVPRTIRVPAKHVTIVESVGAGDAFAAGYLTSRLRGGTPRQRLAAGHDLAAWTLESTADFRSVTESNGAVSAASTSADPERIAR
jgi:2-dehydro-3-deoxygluconokinase